MLIARLLPSIVLVMCFCWTCPAIVAAEPDSRLQGIWFGDGPHPMSRTVLIVDGEKFTIVSPLGVFVSRFSSNATPTLNEIDIDRFDGDQQLGVFEVTETHLRMKLSEPNQVRPTLKDVHFPSGKAHWHTVFKRRPTEEGLEVIAKHSDKLR